MQDKRSVKCSFCDNVVSTTLSAVICPECLKSIVVKNCPGCGRPIKFEAVTKEHQRTWHKDCYAIFGLDEDVDEDITDYDSTVRAKNKKTRKILTGNSTYLFYDTGKDEKSSTEFMSGKGNSYGSTPVRDKGGIDDQHLSFQDEDNEDYTDFTSMEGRNKRGQIPSNVRILLLKMKSLDFIRDNYVDGNIFHNSVTGEEIVSFLIDRKVCQEQEKAKQIGQKLIDIHALFPVFIDEQDTEEPCSFEGETELYYVNNSYLEENEAEDNEEVAQPVKEHNRILRMSGYLTTINKDGKSQRLWYELTANILRSYTAPDSNALEAYDCKEFSVVRITHAKGEQTTSFKLVGSVRELTFQADTVEESYLARVLLVFVSSFYFMIDLDSSEFCVCGEGYSPKDRFKKCIVWSPIHPATWFLPFAGHMAIADSQGNVYDFQGTNAIGKNQLLFGNPTKVIPMGIPGENDEDWDRCVEHAIRRYQHEEYNFLKNNCHDFAACALNEMELPNYKNHTFNCNNLAALAVSKGHFLSFGAFCLSWLPFIAIVAIIIGLFFICDV